METADWIILICLILSAFFSGMEIAYISANRIFLEIEKNKKNVFASLLQWVTHNPSRFIAAMLIGNNIALVIYGIFMGDKIVELLFPAAGAQLSLQVLFFQTLISTGVILITAEFLPKVFFQLYANRLVKFFILPATLFYALFTPISYFVLKLTDGLLYLFFKENSTTDELTFSKVELGNFIEEQVEFVPDKEALDAEIQIFQNALEFADVKAREVMVPRAEIVAIDKTTSIKELESLFASTGLSKIPVYQDSIDDIIGYVHAFEMLKNPQHINHILLPVEFIHEPNPVNEVLNKLARRRKSLAVVLDEYGGTAGLLTIEDIVEELFGEIEDEHDAVAHYEKQLDENTFEFSARLEVDYLNETYDLDLPEEENYETLGGLVVHHTQEIPALDAEIALENYRLKVLEVSSTKIEKIRLTKS